MEEFDYIRKNIDEIRGNISKLKSNAVILGVSKTFNAKLIDAAARCGINEFGESKLQESMLKIPEVSENRENIKWHFIGHLQSNKAAGVVKLFNCVQSVDSMKLAEKISSAAIAAGQSVDLLLELKVSGEESKYGLNPEEIAEIAGRVETLPGIKLKGIMTMAPYSDNAQDARPYFRKARAVFEALRSSRKGFDILSMGMSGDYITALEEGSTMVRIGTGLFGKRNYK